METLYRRSSTVYFRSHSKASETTTCNFINPFQNPSTPRSNGRSLGLQWSSPLVQNRTVSLTRRSKGRRGKRSGQPLSARLGGPLQDLEQGGRLATNQLDQHWHFDLKCNVLESRGCHLVSARLRFSLASSFLHIHFGEIRGSKPSLLQVSV